MPLKIWLGKNESRFITPVDEWQVMKISPEQKAAFQVDRNSSTTPSTLERSSASSGRSAAKTQSRAEAGRRSKGTEAIPQFYDRHEKCENPEA